MGALATISQIALSSIAAYRPPNWGQQQQVYSITCTLPPSSPNGSGNNPNASASSTPQMPTTFFFDATLRVHHKQPARFTSHPVQVGPAIVDHIYLEPYELALDIGISDSMQSYQAGQYSGGSSRSVSAYQTFLAISAARVPITVSTRLNTVQNMGLELVDAYEDNRTFRCLRGTLYFKQIISAQVNTSPTSNRPNATNTTNEGTKSPSTVPSGVSSQLPPS
jgi:hypothetical protein